MSDIRRTKRVRPGYPTREALLADARVLREIVPAGWKPLVAAGGLTVVLTVAGLGTMPAGSARAAETAGTTAAAANARALPIVAPIFEHGEGRAATGCIVVSPPVFISEEEARQIIVEELAKVGVNLRQKDVEMKEIGIRPKKWGTIEKDGKWVSEQVPGDPKPLVADLFDPDKRVAVEFISEKDYYDVGGEQAMSTVQDYDFKKVAKEVAEQIKGGKGGNRFGVFYDPAGRVGNRKPPTVEELAGKSPEEMTKVYAESIKAQTEVAEKAAQEELRQQVRDFAAWLKKQGVI